MCSHLNIPRREDRGFNSMKRFVEQEGKLPRFAVDALTKKVRDFLRAPRQSLVHVGIGGHLLDLDRHGVVDKTLNCLLSQVRWVIDNGLKAKVGEAFDDLSLSF